MIKDPFDLFEATFHQSEEGLKANSRGKLIGSLLGRAVGAVPFVSPNNNLFALSGEQFRFHSVMDGKSFSFNPETEGRRIVVAFRNDKNPVEGQPVSYLMYGVTLDECIAVGRSPKGKSGTSGRLNVPLSKVKGRVRLGVAKLSQAYTEADTVVERDRLMDVIKELSAEKLEAVLDSETKRTIQEFVLSPSKTSVSETGIEMVQTSAA